MACLKPGANCGLSVDSREEGAQPGEPEDCDRTTQSILYRRWLPWFVAFYYRGLWQRVGEMWCLFIRILNSDHVEYAQEGSRRSEAGLLCLRMELRWR